MRVKTPRFWYEGGGGWTALALQPLSCLYALGRKARRAASPAPYKARVPVICLGNLVAGGGGKTPAAIAVLKLLKENGLCQNPVFLSRGYGGVLSGPVPVSKNHSAADVGDEPLLLARHAPVIVAKDRAAGARLAEDSGHDLIVMDDGFQNGVLVKDFSILVIDGMDGFGNGRMLPAGPLREPLTEGLARADAFLLIGEGKAGVTAPLPPGKPVFAADIAADGDGLKKDSPYLAFCGLARPGKFRRTLEAEKVNLTGWREFPDHYPYAKGDIDSLREDARRLGARLLTTEKDAARLGGLIDPADYDVLPVSLRWREAGELLSFLANGFKIHATPVIPSEAEGSV